MKKLVLAAALSAAATTGYAGSMADAKMEPMIEAPVIVEEATSSSAGILVPLLLLVLVAAAVAAD